VPALQPGAMCYMMSKEAYLTDQGSHNVAHLMFFVPEGMPWGENLPDPRYPFLTNKLMALRSP